MLPSLLLLPLTGGFLLLLTQNRRHLPSLVEVLTPPFDTGHTLDTGLVAQPNQSNAVAATVDQNLVLSLGLLSMTMTGGWGIPLLRLLSTSGLVYLDFYFIRHAYAEWQTERQIGMSINDAVLATGLLITRQFTAGSLFATLFFASRKLQVKSENNLAHHLQARVMLTEKTEPLAEPHRPPLLPVPVSNAVTIGKPTWQTWIDQGALPLLTLSALTSPVLGLKRSLAVLLTNFGYDYRLVAPLSTLSYLKVAAAQGIWLRDGLVLDQLHAVDVLVLDVDWDAQMLATLQADIMRPIVTLRDHDPAAHTTVLTQLQAEGRTIAYVSNTLDPGAVAATVDINIALDQAMTTPLPPTVQVVLSSDQPLQLQQLFALTKAFAATQKRGLYLALAPGLLNLGGIYFGHFGVVTALLVDFGGAVVGMLNAVWPQLQATGNPADGQDATA